MDPAQAQEQELFSQRKKDHIQISLSAESQAWVDQFSRLQFQHNPLPEVNLDEIDLSVDVFGSPLQSPLFISSMTLGFEGSKDINRSLVSACAQRGWMMGVGSQRRQLFDSNASKECEELRQEFPDVILFGNIGLSQVIETKTEHIEALVKALGAQFLVVHTNPMQEAIQPEGTPQFRGGLGALSRLCAELSVPVVLKETGCGFSPKSLKQLKTIGGLGAVDVSGLGGTHWGRVEGLRQNPDSLGYKVASTFAHWGISTVDSLENAHRAQVNYPIWASGGVRSGLDAAKLLALGAEKVGFAQPLLAAAMQSQEQLILKMEQLEQELRVSLFCLGLENVRSLIGNRELLQWK
jgi:isopentenyl-diphosphate Delta-isomerase